MCVCNVCIFRVRILCVFVSGMVWYMCLVVCVALCVNVVFVCVNVCV